MKSGLSVFLRVFISVGLIACLIWAVKDHMPQIADTLAKTRIALFALAVAIFATNVMVLSSRLQLLFIGEQLRIPFGRVIQLSFIGYFFNNFMPTAVGGDIVKAYYAFKYTKEPRKSFVAVFMDRFIGLFSFALIATFALLISWKEINIILKKTVLVFSLCAIAASFAMLNTTIAAFIFNMLSKLKLWNMGERLSKIYRAVHEYRNKKRVILMVIAVSIAAQSVYFVIIYILSSAVEAGIVLKTIFLFMPIVSLVSMLPSLGGLGLREGAIVALFGPIIGVDNAFSISVLVFAMLLVISIIGGIIYLYASQFKIKSSEISSLESYNI